MALILIGKSACPICGRILEKGQRLVATTAFLSDSADPLWRFSDAGIHYECFQRWALRAAFVAKYNDTIGASRSANGNRHHMWPDGTIEVIGPGDALPPAGSDRQ